MLYSVESSCCAIQITREVLPSLMASLLGVFLAKRASCPDNMSEGTVNTVTFQDGMKSSEKSNL